MDFSFNESRRKIVEDTVTTKGKPIFDGDAKIDFSYESQTKKLTYEYDMSYAYGGIIGEDRVYTKSSDEFQCSNVVMLKLGKVDLSTRVSVSTQLFNNKNDDDILESSFLSPGEVTWGLGFAYNTDKWFDLNLTFNFAANKSVIFVNQSIYTLQNQEVMNDVPKNKYIFNIIGMDFSYSLQKDFHDNLELTNDGEIFFPGTEKLFSDEWFNYLNFKIDNKISYSILKKMKISVESQFSYNKHLNKTLEWYNKIAIGIIIK